MWGSRGSSGWCAPVVPGGEVVTWRGRRLVRRVRLAWFVRWVRWVRFAYGRFIHVGRVPELGLGEPDAALERRHQTGVVTDVEL